MTQSVHAMKLFFLWSVFVGKAGAFPSETPFKDAPLNGRLLALSKYIKLGWKGLPGANALAYYEKS